MFQNLLAVIVMFGGCVHSPLPRVDGARALREARVSVAGLTIRSSEEDVRAQLGPPLRVTDATGELTGEPERRYFYPEIEVLVVGDEVYNVLCRGSSCGTSEGVDVGQAIERVREVYGEGEVIKREAETLLRYSIETDRYLVFHIQSGRVRAIELWFDYT